MPASCSRAFAIAGAATLVLAAAPVRAQTPDPAAVARAEQSFDEGIAAWKAGDLPTAEVKLRAAHAIVKTPITGLPLGKVLRDEKKWLEARAILDEVSAQRDYPNMSAQARADRDEGRALATSLAKETPTIVVRFVGPDGAVGDRSIAIDGRSHALAELSVPTPIDPGNHAIAVVGGAQACPGTNVRLDSGDKRTVTWEIAAGSGAPREDRTSYPWPTIGFGVAIGATAIGSVTGIIAIGKASMLRRDCAGHVCPAASHDGLTSANAVALASSIAFGLATMGAAFGVGALLLRPSSGSDVVAPACRGPQLATSSTSPLSQRHATPAGGAEPRPTTSLVVHPFGIGGTF